MINNKPKILFLMHMIPPVHGAAIIGQYIHDNIELNKEFECIYLNPSASKNIRDIGKIGIKKLLFFAKFLLKVLMIIHVDKPQYCYLTPSAWDWGFYRDCFTILLLKIFRMKIIIHMHNKGEISFYNKWYNDLLYRFFYKNIKVILLSELLYPELNRYVKKDNIFICPNGIPIINDQRISKTYNYGKLNFLFFSNMMEKKGVYILLESCAQLKQKKYNFHCDFVGNWSDVTENDFITKVNELNISDIVHAHGAKYGNDKFVFFSNSDILVFPTFYDTFGLVILEAMQFSLPCISTDEGGVPSIIIDKKTGLIAKKRDIEDFAKKMEYMIQNPHLCNEMGENGYNRYIDNFTLEHFNNRIFHILKDFTKK